MCLNTVYMLFLKLSHAWKDRVVEQQIKIQKKTFIDHFS